MNQIIQKTILTNNFKQIKNFTNNYQKFNLISSFYKTQQLTYIPSQNYIESKTIYKKIVPEKYYPYIELGRYEKPIGYMLLFWPCTWGLALGMSVANPLSFVHMFGTFFTGSVIMRAAGCIINDMWDKDLDKKVDRTKTRPLASGNISTNQASMFLALHLSGGLAVLTQLNWTSIYLAFGIMPGVIIYPYMKRISYYPQFVLGTVFNWGIIVGYAAMTGNLDYGIALSTYIGAIQWTIIYDTIYGHQDKLDDQKVGIKSTALAWGENTKKVLTGFNIGQFICLCSTGHFMDFHMSYYVALALGQLRLQYLINQFDIDDPKSCGSTFVSNSQYGAYLLSVFLGSQLIKYKIQQQNNQNDQNSNDQQQKQIKLQ